jgi:hypothetical protein
MKKYLAAACLLGISFLFISFPAFPQDPQEGTAGLLLKEQEFDYGKVNEGSIIEHDFIILNQGDAVLEIRKVSPG